MATNAERQAAFRKRQAEQLATEVRGIFAHKDDHAAIKNYAAKLAKKRAKAANVEFSGGAPLHGAASDGTQGSASCDSRLLIGNGT